MRQEALLLEGQEYIVATIKTGEAKHLKGKFADPLEFTVAIVAGSLRAGGDASATHRSVEELPYFPVFVPLSSAARRVNGLELQGEDQAVPATKTASTSDESTQP